MCVFIINISYINNSKSNNANVCRIAVFSVRVLKDERVVVIAEQRPECAEEEVANGIVV